MKALAARLLYLPTNFDDADLLLCKSCFCKTTAGDGHLFGMLVRQRRDAASGDVAQEKKVRIWAAVDACCSKHYCG